MPFRVALATLHSKFTRSEIAPVCSMVSRRPLRNYPGKFIPNLSIVDVVMNCCSRGPGAMILHQS